MKTIREHKATSFIIVILVAVILFLLLKQNKKPHPASEESNSIQAEKENITPVSISVKEIKEENFTGKMAEVSGSAKVATEAKDYIEKRVEEFRNQANTDVPDIRDKFGDDSPTANYSIDLEAKYLKGDKTESIVITNYTYTGGAHGSSSYKVLTASRASGQIISLSDVIKKDKQSAFLAFVKTQLNQWKPSGSDSTVVFPEEVKGLTFDSFENWSLDAKNLTIYFDQYEIGPGVLGAVAFPLPFTKIKDLLSPAYF